MASHPQLLLLEKLYEILTEDSELSLLVNGNVWENVPDNPTYPFVEIGDFILNDFDTHTSDGVDGEFHIHVWTQSDGRKENMEIGNRIYELLHNQDLQITGFPTIACYANLNEILREPDNRTHHGIQRYKVMLGGN